MRSLAVALLVLATLSTAEARPRTPPPPCGGFLEPACPAPRSLRREPGEGVTYLPHPAGCPRRLFCGCGAAVEFFGKPVRELWLARSWFRFPRTTPAPNTAAVRRGHVFKLVRHVRDDVWLVVDHNSGGHRSRLHERSIRGYVIVDPLS